MVVKNNLDKYDKMLIVIVVLVALIKIYLSFDFHTPFILSDEYFYSSYAKDIISDPFYVIKADQFQICPPGYPLLIIPSFIFYPNMEMVYSSILVVNVIFAIFTTLISYVILERFVPKDLAFFGSVLISLLPSSTLYGFIIFSENLYIPLYLFSGYLLLKSFDSSDRLLHIFTGLIIFYLTITRGFGILAYVSFFIVIFYKFLTERDRIGFLRKYHFLVGTPVILLGMWTILKRTYDSGLYKYNSDVYTQNMVYVFSDIQNFILFLKLVINEMDYLMLTSYFIFFIFSISILLYWKKLDQSIKIYVLYSFIYAALSIILTVLHMIQAVKDPDSSEYMYYFIWGRYVDPILPTIFIIGLISWSRLILSKDKNFDIRKLVSISAILVMFFIVTYPYYANYKIVNVLSICYVKDIIYMGHYFLYLLPIILLIPCLSLLKRPKILIMVLIIFSLVISIPSYTRLKYASSLDVYMDDIGKLLYKINGSILIDKEYFTNDNSGDYYHSDLIRFWAMPNNLIYGYNLTNLSPDIRYILTKKPLPYEIVSVSQDNTILYNPDNIILYKSDIVHDVQVIHVTGFYKQEHYANNINYTWIDNNATLYVYVPYMNLTNSSLMFEAGSFYKPRNLQTYLNDKLVQENQIYKNSTNVQMNVNLEIGENFIRFYIPEGCQKPSDVTGSTDARCLGIYFRNISLVSYTNLSNR